MRETITTKGGYLSIETGTAKPDATTIVERKGLGHPDTLADHLAERLSRAYSRYTVERFGAVLHHNFDKLALLGGASEVRYGAGRMTAPVRVQVNGGPRPGAGARRSLSRGSSRPRSGRSSPSGSRGCRSISTSPSTSPATPAPERSSPVTRAGPHPLVQPPLHRRPA
ncbi:hypothetical protein GCM10023238_06040 [Streptomyces heliomycini]